MARQSGLGRGLAALLAPAAGDPIAVVAPQEHLEILPPGAMAEFGAELVAELATNESGIGVIYRALDNLVEHFQLRDAAVVIDEPGLGRQIFTAGRRPLEDEEEELLAAEPGLYTDPVLEPEQFDAALLTSLCVVSLRLDLLQYDAWHDPLTGLDDRRSFDRLLEMAIARSRRYDWRFTLVILDLDEFKDLNDRDGHAAGDAALRALGDRFRHVLRFGDNAARIGGDEFALILPDTKPDDVPSLLARVEGDEPGRASVQKFSSGVAECPTDADDFDTLFQLADQRLYVAKAGRQ